MLFLFMVLIQRLKPSAEAPAETRDITVLFILADELEEFLIPFVHSMPEQAGCRQTEMTSDIGWRFLIFKAAAGGVNLVVV